jgi:hypothetical protein
MVRGDVHLLTTDVDLDHRKLQALEVGEGLERLAVSRLGPIEPALDGIRWHLLAGKKRHRGAIGEIRLELAHRNPPRGKTDERRGAGPGELDARPHEHLADSQAAEVTAPAPYQDEALLRLTSDVTAEAPPPPLVRAERILEYAERGNIVLLRPVCGQPSGGTHWSRRPPGQGSPPPDGRCHRRSTPTTTGSR